LGSNQSGKFLFEVVKDEVGRCVSKISTPKFRLIALSSPTKMFFLFISLGCEKYVKLSNVNSNTIIFAAL
jgi:hypothetical protein